MIHCNPSCFGYVEHEIVVVLAEMPPVLFAQLSALEC